MTHRAASVVVIGAGQAGLSAGHHLRLRGFASALAEPGASRTVVMLDAGEAPGGAWRHRWSSLTMSTVNGIFDLPDFPQPAVDPDEPSRDAVPRYFAAFERAEDLPIVRPVAVEAVRRADRDPRGPLLVETNRGTWRARAVVNATGTWTNPVIPDLPGRALFRGAQLHTRDYVGASTFAGQRVAIVGGGISAVQHLDEISRVAETRWYTRREPVFRDGAFRPEIEGRETIARVTAAAEAGEPPRSIVSYTGLLWNDHAIAARDRGALVRHPMFARIEPEGVREADGSLTPLEAILWATGFAPALGHLDPLGLRSSAGGVVVRGTRVVADPRVHLVGYGPSQSTVGANRAGRDAAREIARRLDDG
ncbi:NAD(P)-binding domain-containing protein [Microbacterium sp. gxy059]|uniref:NAD(P)-binding domain-containing protein n=1 Tax=Microbacterium sp. gxy059 TaxID=2957199 RepID=UPI003D97E263